MSHTSNVRLRAIAAAFALTGVVLAAPAAAQERRATEQDERNQREAARESVRQLQPEGALVLPQPQFTLTAERGKQAVSGTIGVAVDNWGLDTTFSGPIGETDTEASPLTLGGLQNGASVRFGFSYGTITKARITAEDVDEISDLCARLGLGDDCDTTDIQNPVDRAEFIRVLLPRVSVLWGVHLTLNREKFTYSPDEGLTDVSESHVNQAVTGSLGFLMSNLWFVGGHIEQQRFRKAGSAATQVCIPSGSRGATSCRPTRLKPPTDLVKKSLLTIEGRRIFVRSNIGINPRFTADLDDEVQTYELPVYFLREQQDASKNPVPSLNGGVSVGWHSKDGAVLRAFVGVAFKLVSLR